MMRRLTTIRLLCGVVLASAIAVPAAAQGAGPDTLARAKDFYASASYEEALQVLVNLHGKIAATDAADASAYEYFCLMALGRKDQAKTAVEALVKIDPLYHPSDAQASPRVRTFFEDVRRPLLPDVIRHSYADAKAAYDKKDLAAAASGFERVIALLDDAGDIEDAGLADLRTLANGFHDLSKVPAKPVAPPPAVVPPTETTTTAPADPPPAATASNNSAANSANRVYGPQDSDVKKPITISRETPTWVPSNPIEAMRTYSGTIEIVVGEDGKVISASITKSVLASYDDKLLASTKNWRFKPATKDGAPVKYRLAMNIQLGR